MLREIVRIDEDKCNGCGLCVPACAEGAIRIIDGKARLLADNLCDGLGACLGHCPQDAILIEKRPADGFDEHAVAAHLEAGTAAAADGTTPAGGCPSAQVRQWPPAVEKTAPETPVAERQASELRQWPVQLHLVPPSAPFLQDADLLLAADCTAFAAGDIHQRLLQGKALLIGCPKLDDGPAYLDKLTAILQQNSIRSLTVAHMEVPCCSGLVALARQAREKSGKDLPLTTVEITIDGRQV